MEVGLQTTVVVSAEKLAKEMTAEEIAEFLDIVAHRFDKDFATRKEMANTFAEHTSEVGARFLAEVVASTMYRAQ